MKGTCYGALLLAKAEFKSGNFEAAKLSVDRAREFLETVPEEGGQQKECSRYLAVFGNKANIELSAEKLSCGDINAGAIMASSSTPA